MSIWEASGKWLFSPDRWTFSFSLFFTLILFLFSLLQIFFMLRWKTKAGFGKKGEWTNFLFTGFLPFFFLSFFRFWHCQFRCFLLQRFLPHFQKRIHFSLFNSFYFYPIFILKFSKQFLCRKWFKRRKGGKWRMSFFLLLPSIPPSSSSPLFPFLLLGE